MFGHFSISHAVASSLALLVGIVSSAPTDHDYSSRLGLVVRAPQAPPPWQARHQVLCEGVLPTQFRRMTYRVGHQSFSIEFTTPQEFCALAHYGGHQDVNLAGWWSPWHQMIGFGPMGHDAYLDSLGYHAAEILCSLRCKGLPFNEAESEEAVRAQTAALIAEAADPERAPLKYTVFNKNNFEPHNRKIVVLRSPESYPVTPEDPLPRQFAYSVSTVGTEALFENNLRCRGALPAIDKWPFPFNTPNPQEPDEHSPNRPWRDVTALCAALTYGGDARGNAGGVCRKDRHGKTVFSIISTLAHPALYRANSLYGGRYIDLFCHIACDCPDDEEEAGQPYKKTKTVNLGNDITGQLTMRENGKLVFLTGKTLPGGNPEAYRVEDASDRKWGRCTGKGQNEVCTDIPESQVNPMLVARLNDDQFIFDIKAAQPAPQPQQCGVSCSSVKDCNSAGGCNSCVYHPSKRLVHASGLSPFLPLAAAMCLSLSKSVSHVGGLGGRAVEALNTREFGLLDEGDEGATTCLCNATYASTKCCDAELDGIVHGDLGQELWLA